MYVFQFACLLTTSNNPVTLFSVPNRTKMIKVSGTRAE